MLKVLIEGALSLICKDLWFNWIATGSVEKFFGCSLFVSVCFSGYSQFSAKTGLKMLLR